MKKTGLKIFLSMMLSTGLIISCGGTSSTSEQIPTPSAGTTGGSTGSSGNNSESETPTPAANEGGSESPSTTATKYTLSGTITGGASAQGITVTVTATGYSGTATTDASGKYSLSDLSGATYTVTPTKIGMVFNPANLFVTDLAANKTDANFAAADIKSKTLTSTLSPNMTLSICSDDEKATSAGSSPIVGVKATNSDFCISPPESFRTYFKFDMTGIETDSIIQSATLSFYSDPDFSVYPSGDLTIDHVDFGADLNDGNTADWDTATNGSITNAINSEMVSIDAKAFVTSDCDAGRGYSEYRLSFPNTTPAGKYITVSQTAGKLPTLAITYYKF